MSAPALQQYIQGQGTVSADNLNTFEQTCDTVADLLSFTGVPGQQVYVRGRSAVADGGNGEYYWNAGLTPPGDGFNAVIPAGSVQGGWSRLPPSGPSLNEASATGVAAGATGAFFEITSVAAGTAGTYLFIGNAEIVIPSGCTLSGAAVGLSSSAATITFATFFLPVTIAGPQTMGLSVPAFVENVVPGTQVFLVGQLFYSGSPAPTVSEGQIQGVSL